MTAWVARQIVIWKSPKCKNKYFILTIPSPRNFDEGRAGKVAELAMDEKQCLHSLTMLRSQGLLKYNTKVNRTQLRLEPKPLPEQILKRSKDNPSEAAALKVGSQAKGQSTVSTVPFETSGEDNLMGVERGMNNQSTEDLQGSGNILYGTVMMDTNHYTLGPTPQTVQHQE